MASTYLTAGTMGSTTSRKKFTISFWAKRGALGEEYMFFAYNASSLANYKLQIGFVNDDTLEIRGVDGGSQHTRLVTNRKFRDTNAWYHFYFAFDSTQGTASDRIKIYINGEQETSLSTSTYPNLNTDFAVGVDGSINYTLKIGTWGSGGNYWSGSMSHYYYVDGSVISQTQFGSTDSTTGEWKINTSPTIASYGNEGFLILKDGNTVTDQSPNSNNLTVGGGTLTKTEDNPSNVFATWNPLDNYYSNFSIQYGNLEVNTPSTSDTSAPLKSTIGVNFGKWYWEVKCVSVNSGSWTYGTIGITSRDIKTNAQGNHLGSYTEDYVYYSYNGHILNADGGNTGDTYGNTYTSGDIIGVALDLDNNKLYFSKNGVWQNSGDPTSGSTGTGAVSINAPTVGTNATGNYFPAVGDYHYAPRYRFAANFGNGTFQTTAITTNNGNGYQDADGNGIMNYSVPANYRCLCTKGLNQ